MTRQIATTALLALLATPALAAPEGAGKPVPGGTGFQEPVTQIMRDLIWLDDFLLLIITAITIFVTALLGWCIYRYNEKRNPEPATFTHNATIEVVWTAIPVLILVIIAIPSLRLLFDQLDVPEPDLTLKVTGNQWYWSYEYPAEGINMDAYMLDKEELADFGYQPDEYLLATDTRVVVPVDKVVHVLVTGSDVIHNWAVPSFGVKIDTIPGRVNETWFKAEEVGTYFGQCSELCGMLHAYMPITIEVVEQTEYDAWVAEEQAKAAGATDLAKAE
ncbi:MAG: cytochrome c oxidase subunit II [Pseudomonadota bacterium]